MSWGLRPREAQHLRDHAFLRNDGIAWRRDALRRETDPGLRRQLRSYLIHLCLIDRRHPA